MDALYQDLRYALRTLRRNPGFSIVAALTLALGIGGNTAIFTVVDAVLLRPLPYEEPDRLVRVLRTHPTAPYTNFSYPDLQDLKVENTAFAEVAGYSETRAPLTGGPEPAVLPTARVTDGFFSVLGAGPLRGRLFRSADFERGAENVLLLSYETWQGRFGGDPEIVGRQVTFGEESHTVVGVLSAGLRYPSPETAVWAPARLHENSGRGSRWLSVIGRLAPDASLQEAQVEARVIAERLAQEYPEVNRERAITLESLREHMVGDVRLLFLLLFGAVGLVLLIACANVANLTLSRAATREREIAIRRAVGADRGRLVSQLITESVVTSLAGGLVGVLLAVWTVDLFLALSPADIPRQSEVALDGRVLAFAFLLTLATGLLAGLLPAVRTSRPDLSVALKEGAAGAGAGRANRRWRSGLAVAQIALSVVLLVGAGLLIKSLWRLQQVDPGFRNTAVASVNLVLPASRYADPQSGIAFFDRLSERASGLPGVERVSVASMLPFTGHNYCSGFTLEGRSDQEETCAEFRAVGPDYFRVMGIPRVRGRTFVESDDSRAPRVAVVNETMARTFWPEGRALGARFTIFGESWEIVGVVGSVRHFGLDRDPRPALYLPYRQRPMAFANLVVRTAGAPKTLLPPLRRAVWDLDPDMPIYGLDTLDGLVAESVAAPRFRTALLGTLAALALLLAAVGIYGVIAYDVSQRTREIGIRMTLGARSADVFRRVLLDAGRVAGLGLALGLAGALIAGRTLRSFLFQVDAVDATVSLGAALFLAAVALTAGYLPARRAAHTDPMKVLREE